MRSHALAGAIAAAALAGCHHEAARGAEACVAEACTRGCEAGDAAACARGAELYQQGSRGHPLDLALAARLAEQGCAASNGTACLHLGRQLQDALGVPWDPTRAIAIYERGCALGAGTACHNLGGMYLGGHGVDPDPERGEAYLAKAQQAWRAACEGSEPRWCTNLAWSLAGSSTAEVSEAVGREMMTLDQRACDAKVLAGCIEVVRLRYQRKETPAADFVTALERLCRDGEPPACTQAGAILLDGTMVANDPVRAEQLLRQACEAGDSDGCTFLAGDRTDRRPIALDREARVGYLVRGCDRASPFACNELARLYAASDDRPHALASSRRACWMGDSDSCALVGTAYTQGWGVSADPVEASRWMGEACRGGSAEGCAYLERGGAPLPLPLELRTRMRDRLCGGGVTESCQRRGT